MKPAKTVLCAVLLTGSFASALHADLAKDKNFHEFYGTEIGSDASHQEYDPPQHPGLFRAKP